MQVGRVHGHDTEQQVHGESVQIQLLRGAREEVSLRKDYQKSARGARHTVHSIDLCQGAVRAAKRNAQYHMLK